MCVRIRRVGQFGRIRRVVHRLIFITTTKATRDNEQKNTADKTSVNQDAHPITLVDMWKGLDTYVTREVFLLQEIASEYP